MKLFPVLRHILPHSQPSTIYAYLIDERIGPGEINIFKRVGSKFSASKFFRVQLPVHINKHHFTGADIADERKSKQRVHRIFRRENIFLLSVNILTDPVNKRPDSMGIAKSKQTLASDDAYDRISSVNPFKYIFYCGAYSVVGIIAGK